MDSFFSKFMKTLDQETTLEPTVSRCTRELLDSVKWQSYPY